MNVVWRLRAEQQFRRELDYVRQHSPRGADRMRNRVEQRVARLADFPFSGRPSRQPNIRELVIFGTPDIAVYRVRGPQIEILRFFHASQRR
jgi:toxin ParE1/3/4